MSRFSWGCKRYAYAILKVMRQGSKQNASSIRHSGYTIIEVMIFLVVTGTLLISAMAIFNGRQVRTEYVQSIRETDQRIQTVINEVATGYFPERDNFSCTATATQTQISPLNPERQGGNEDCVFLGKVIQFGVDGDKREYAVHTVAGSRLEYGTNQIATTLDETHPAIVSQVTETFRVPYGGEVYRVATACGGNDIAGFAILQSLGNVAGGDPISGSQSVDVYPLCATDFGDSLSAANTVGFVPSYENYKNHQNGIAICFGDESFSTKFSSIRLGGRANSGTSGSPTTTDVAIDTGVDTRCG